MGDSPTSFNIKTLCDDLNSEPLFHLSLHSKELFHSNVLAWFAQSYPNVATQLFRRWVPARKSERHKIQREHGQLDLILELPDLAPIVIENKVFAPVDDDQLERYTWKKGLDVGEDPTFILMSLGSPNWNHEEFVTSTGQSWKHVSYRDLATSLSKVVHLVPNFDGDLLGRYLRFISLLQQLVDLVGTPSRDEPIELVGVQKEALQSIRLYDSITKLRTRFVIKEVAQSVRNLSSQGDVRFHSNFTHGQPLLEAFVSLRNGDSIGWQYQGAQWRLAVKTNVHHGKTIEARERRHAYVASKYADWFNFAKLSELLGHKMEDQSPTEKKGELLGYNPNFVYLYRKIPDLSIEGAVQLCSHYISQAIEWGE